MEQNKNVDTEQQNSSDISPVSSHTVRAQVKADIVSAPNNAVPEHTTLFTRREWIMRYASPMKALLFMAGPMVIIMIVNSLYGIIDKQLALNFATQQVKDMIIAGNPMNLTGYIGNNIVDIKNGADLEQFAKVFINASTQYSYTVITLLDAMSLLTSVGTAILWGQAMGERDKARMDSIELMGVIQTLVISGLGVLIIHFVNPYIITSQADISYGDHELSLIYQLSYDYTNTFIYGFPLLAFATFISTLIRTEGKVWWVIFINLSAIVLNIVCGEAFLKANPNMSSAVFGSMVAWGWMIASGLAVICISKNSLLFPDFRNVKLKLKDAGIIWLYGISPFVSNFIFAVANYVSCLLITISHDWLGLISSNGSLATDGLYIAAPIKTVVPDPATGTAAVGPQTAVDLVNDKGIKGIFVISPALQTMSSCFPWMNLIYSPFLGMMQGANANYAYCKGAGKRFRLVQIWREHILIDIIWGFMALAIVAIAGGPMMELFGFENPGQHKWWFLAYICGLVLGGMTYSALSLFQGIGDSLNATLVALLRSLVCNVGFIVAGWAIVRFGFHTNPKADWIIFLFNGICEIPAAIAGMWLVWKYFNKLLKHYQVNDTPDSFKAPSLLKAAENEVTIAENTYIAKAQKAYNREVNDLKKTKLYTDKEAKRLKMELDKKIALIHYNAAQKTLFMDDKYRFHNQTFGNGTANLHHKQLEEWYEKQQYLISVSGSVTKEQDMNALEALYKEKLDVIDKKHAKKMQYIRKVENGEVKLTPFSILFVDQEPQPLDRQEIAQNKALDREQAEQPE